MRNFKKIIPPSECPSCGGGLDLVKDQLFCRNPVCSAQVFKKVEHFCKTVKIKGMGPKTIDNLGIESIPELYELTEDTLINSLGEKIGIKLYKEIQNAKTVSFPTLLAAFSIPLIGNTAASKLGDIVSNINELTDDVAKRAGLGTKATYNLLTWLKEDWETELMHLPITQVPPAKYSGTTVASKNATVVITGKLNDFKNRTEAKSHLESLGFDVKSSVSKNTNYLVDEEGRVSSSRTKAEKYGVTILTIKELEELFQ